MSHPPIEHIEDAVDYANYIRSIKHREQIEHMHLTKSLKGFDTFSSIISYIIYPTYFSVLKSQLWSVYATISYAEFREWNYFCIRKLKKDQRKSLSKVCKTLCLHRFAFMDTTTYTIGEPGGFYYDHSANLVIYYPRPL